MDRRRLEELLAELRAELAGADRLDPGTRESLRQTAADLERLAGGDAQASALEQLRDGALRLESEHPRLAGVLGQVADTLGKMGI